MSGFKAKVSEIDRFHYAWLYRCFTKSDAISPAKQEKTMHFKYQQQKKGKEEIMALSCLQGLCSWYLC